MIVLNLDLSDVENDILNQKKIEEDLKIKEIEKKEYFKQMSHKYSEQLQLVLTYEIE